MGLCKDCRWWERRQSSTKWRPCALTRTHDSNAKEDHPESLAFGYVNTDGWDATVTNASLLTAPDFGCVQFEAK